MRRTIALAVVGIAAAGAAADGVDPRATVLAVEMRRGPAEALEPFLAPDADPAVRPLAIRALGRIGERGSAPRLLAALLERGGPDLPVVLWAAGAAQSKGLVEPIARHLASGDPAIVGAAAAALGWTDVPEAAARLVLLLDRPEPPVRAGAIEALARLRADEALERAVSWMTDPDPVVRREAEFAAWMLAGVRREKAMKRASEAGEGTEEAPPPWTGDPQLAERLLPLLRSEDPERRLAALRPVAILLPTALTAEAPFGVVFDLLDDPDARVVQDVVGRVLSRREGADVDAALARALGHADPKVRAMAAEALGAHGSERAKTALAARLPKEPDLRVRETIAVEMARVGDESAMEGIERRSARPSDPVLRATTEIEGVLASRRPEALPDLLLRAVAGETSWPAPAWMALLDGLEGRKAPGVETLLLRLLRPPPAPGPGAPRSEEDPYVRAAAASLAGKQALPGLLDAVLAASEDPAVVLREAAAEALGALGKAEGLPEGAGARARARVTALLGDDAAVVRRAARAAAKDLAMEGVPAEDPRQPNDWRGLPRPARPVLGVDLSAGGPWLAEAEILRLADRIAQARPRILFETTEGTFAVEVEPAVAPVHAVALVLAAERGTYRDTRWHRVVPDFVIQGGDPHGHGAGDAGYSIPDEISPLRFVRGTLGMPKSTKDTGGCQVFFMHSAYRPLDGRYTAYGRVVAGLDVVDRIRVGDRLLDVRLAP